MRVRACSFFEAVFLGYRSHPIENLSRSELENQEFIQAQTDEGRGREG